MRTLFQLGFCLALGIVGASQPMAQRPASSEPIADTAEENDDVRILEIRGGQVIMNGRSLPSANLPDGLNLQGIDMSFQFSGPVIPVVEIDGEVYAVMGDHMMPLEETGRNASQAYFMAEPSAPPMDSEMIRTRVLNQPVEELVQAGQEAYLHQLSNRDLSLYNQIRQEQSLEMETHQLAQQIRFSDDENERADLEVQLRQRLEQSFELKQQIRANEIAQAEEQIDILRDLLETRAARKQQIIDRRFLELTRKNGH